MPEPLSIHEPLLVNTLGHAAGAVVFGTFAYLLLRDRTDAGLRHSRLTLAAALLAFAWNLASLLALSVGRPELPVAIAFCALSALPAVLLHLSLASRLRPVTAAGYGLSLLAAALHLAELFTRSETHHAAALALTTVGFAVLTAISGAASLARRATASRTIGTMALFLFALSVLHLGDDGPSAAWHVELLVHHAGIPLALFVLLQDHRFLLLDAFLRMLANLLLAAAFVFPAAWWGAGREMTPGAFGQGLLLVGACLALLLFAVARAGLQGLLTRLVFRRPEIGRALEALRRLGAEAEDETALVQQAGRAMALYAGTDLVGVGPRLDTLRLLLPTPVADLGEWRERLEARGVAVVVPIRPSTAEERLVLLGRRPGGRRYLSEDLQALAMLAVEAARQWESLRESQMRRLVSQAELRALQSQINPHFLFNALNALYGVIPREAAGARRTVLNLADIFRYFLQADRTFIPLDEELRIVSAYLEIEHLRLGSRLRTEIDVDDDARAVPIPILTVQPLVENAVKHGIASRAQGGTVTVTARRGAEALLLSVRDTGGGFGRGASDGAGVGLENVASRLRLCYGLASELEVDSGPEGTTVRFRVPTRERVEALQP